MSLKCFHRIHQICGCSAISQTFITPNLISFNRKGIILSWSQRCRYLSRATSLASATVNSPNKEDAIGQYDVVPVEKIRNFSIIAHVDHGKSTLADRLLELTGAWSPDMASRQGPGQSEQVLDKLQVEQERGITVKAQTARLLYNYDGSEYHLNLIDTPGHVDFSNEVSRSVAVCQGVILLVDANQGIQAQTLANYRLAADKGLVIIPVLNKCDLKNADPDRVALQLQSLLSIDPDSALRISAKTGLGVPDVLRSIVELIPPPPANRNAPLRAVIFDGWMDTYKGAITLLSVIDGKVRVGDRISVLRPSRDKHERGNYEVKGLGQLCPEEMPRKQLIAGEVGYLCCNMKSKAEATLGATVHHEGKTVEALPGFSAPRPVVFASIFPVVSSDFPRLRVAIEKLTLNDSGVVCTHETTLALGAGYRFGFLGLLHMEVFIQRLENEYDAETIVTAPSVQYEALVQGEKNKKKFGKKITISSASNLPLDPNNLLFLEPLIKATVITPDEYVDRILQLCESKRGRHESTVELGDQRSIVKLIMPLNEIIVDFHDQLKWITSGYASFDYEECGFERASIVKLDVLLNQVTVPELSTLVHAEKAVQEAKVKALKLKETIPRKQFLITVQVCIGKKVLAREDIKPYRKDVTAKLYGGDDTRRQKLVAQQAAGKKKMRMIGKIDLPRSVYTNLLKS